MSRRRSKKRDIDSTEPFVPFDPKSERGRRWLAWLTMLIVAAGLGWTALGHRLDAPVEITAPVNDLAGVIRTEDAWRIDDAIRSLRDATGVQMAVLTVRTTGGVPIDDYSYAVAEAWGGGRAGTDDGVLFTLAIDDRRMRLEVGRGLEYKLTDGEAARIIDTLPPLLRDQRYGAALARVVDRVAAEVGGVAGVEDILTGGGALPAETLSGGSLGVAAALALAYGRGFTAARGVLLAGLMFMATFIIALLWARGGQKASQRARYLDNHPYMLGFAFGLVTASPLVAGLVLTFHHDMGGEPVGVSIVLGFLALVFGLPLSTYARRSMLRYWRAHPRPCLDGSGMMKRIDPEGPESDLTAGQKTEIAILSREYDVWRCPDGHVHPEEFKGSAPADDCSRCNNATRRPGSWRTVRSATYTRSGLRERTHNCAHCGYSYTEKQSIARKTRSSSSSSSGGGFSSGGGGGGWSGGGGSFGGGGASGSW